MQCMLLLLRNIEVFIRNSTKVGLKGFLAECNDEKYIKLCFLVNEAGLKIAGWINSTQKDNIPITYKSYIENETSKIPHYNSTERQKNRRKTCEEDNIIALYKMRQETMRVEQIKDQMRVLCTLVISIRVLKCLECACKYFHYMYNNYATMF